MTHIREHMRTPTKAPSGSHTDSVGPGEPPLGYEWVLDELYNYVLQGNEYVYQEIT